MSTLVTRPRGERETRSRTVPKFSSWFDSLLENDLGNRFLSNFNDGISLPAVNIIETAENFNLELAVPGMEKSDFNIDIDNKILSISSEKLKEINEEQGTYTRREFGYSTFKRSFSLPDSVESEKIEAKYNNGILSVNLPKREEAKQKPARQIKIS